MTGVSAIEYHDRTKHTPRSVRESDFRLDFDNKPTPYKAYENLDSVSLGEAPSPDLMALRAIAGTIDPGAGATARGGGGSGLDREAIAALCHYGAGITKTLTRGDRELAFRAAACTGALYHVELYVVCGDRSDLDAGVYHYDPTAEALDVLREGDFRDVLAAATACEGVGDAQATIVATSTWWRNAWKYRERTYRHAFWDAGTILANLLAVATAHDLSASVVTGFVDGDVAGLLGVDPAREAPIAMVPVGVGARDGDGSRGGGGDASDTAEADVTAGSPRSVPRIDPETRPLSPDEKRHELIEEAYRASSLPDADAVTEWRAGAPGGRLGTRDPGDGQRVELDPVSDDRAAKTPLGVAIERRGSCREYARETLNFRKVSTVLDRATRGIPADVGGERGAGRESDAGGESRLRFVDAYLIVHDVAGVDPGAYHYHPGAGELELLREGEFRREAGHLALDQGLAADAGLCVYFMSDVGEVTDRLGDRGYRVAQLEAAIAAGRLYLGAYAHRDLGATGLTFYDDEVTAFLEPRAADQTPMFLWTLGRPA
jgi:SagB-type dehydrogenase family enzyme